MFMVIQHVRTIPELKDLTQNKDQSRIKNILEFRPFQIKHQSD